MILNIESVTTPRINIISMTDERLTQLPSARDDYNCHMTTTASQALLALHKLTFSSPTTTEDDDDEYDYYC